MREGLHHRSRRRSRRGSAPAGLASLVMALQLAGLVLAGCFVDVDLGGSRLQCSDGRCPDGFECIDALCVADGQGGANDAGADEADAAPQPDAAPEPDGAPDGAPPDAPLPSACDEQYGRAPGYVLCEEDQDSCQFFLETKVAASCNEHCLNIGGGTCLEAFNADPGAECDLQKPTGCESTINQSQVCVCSLNNR